MKSYYIFFALMASVSLATAQPSWKLVRDKNGIHVYTASIETLKFKSIRVQTVLEGTIPKLMQILGDVSKHPEWVYKAKSATFVKQLSPYEFIYYTETILPWPASNRDAIIHLTMVPDTALHSLNITAFSEPDLLEKKEGLVRIPYTNAKWHVTELNNQITIDYVFEVDPGGDLPAWLVNMLADKGPFESFYKLKMKLKL
jgi:hypothetical protein